jgi:hypothetical protein
VSKDTARKFRLRSAQRTEVLLHPHPHLPAVSLVLLQFVGDLQAAYSAKSLTGWLLCSASVQVLIA